MKASERYHACTFCKEQHRGDTMIALPRKTPVRERLGGGLISCWYVCRNCARALAIAAFSAETIVRAAAAEKRGELLTSVDPDAS